MDSSDCEKGDYAFTLTIPPKKKIFWGGRRRYYSDLTQHQQFVFLEGIILLIWKGAYTMKYVYEQHTENRTDLHIHGLFYNEYHEVVRLFIDSFYNHSRIGIPSPKKYGVLSDISICFDTKGWEEYLQKEPIYKPLVETKSTTADDSAVDAEFYKKPYLFGKLKKYCID